MNTYPQGYSKLETEDVKDMDKLIAYMHEPRHPGRVAVSNVHHHLHREERSKLKRGLSGTINGLKVAALADTGAAQNVVSSDFARAWRLDVAGSPSSFRQGNSKLAHTLGTSKNRFDNMTK